MCMVAFMALKTRGPAVEIVPRQYDRSSLVVVVQRRCIMHRHNGNRMNRVICKKNKTWFATLGVLLFVESHSSLLNFMLSASHHFFFSSIHLILPSKMSAPEILSASQAPESTGPKPKVLIAGAGIGGLTLALLLHKANVPFLVLERANEIKPLGKAIDIRPSYNLRSFSLLHLLALNMHHLPNKHFRGGFRLGTIGRLSAHTTRYL